MHHRQPTTFFMDLLYREKLTTERADLNGLQGQQVSPACPAGGLLISLQVFSLECLVFPHTCFNLFVVYTVDFGMTGMTEEIQALLVIQNISGNVCYPAYLHFHMTREDVHNHREARLSKQWKCTTILNVFVFLIMICD